MDQKKDIPPKKANKQTKLMHKKSPHKLSMPASKIRLIYLLHKSRVSKLNKSVLQITYFLQDPFPLEARCACSPSVNSLQSVIRHRPTWLDFFSVSEWQF